MNKIIFIIVFVIIVSAGIFSMVFLVKRSSSINGTATMAPVAAIVPELAPEAPAAKPQQEIIQPRYTVDTNYFILTLPVGWDMTSEEDTLPIIATDSNDDFINEKVKEINFKTSLSINQAKLGEGNSFKSYAEGTRASLLNTIPIIEITKEENFTISGKEAYAMEIESIQQDLKFGTLVVLAAGRENTIWAFSFNTLEESWAKYKDVFYDIIQGLQMK